MKHRIWRGLCLAASLVLPVGAQPFVPAQTRVEIVGNPVATHVPLRVPLTTSGGFDLAELSVTSDATWVSATVLPEASALQLDFATRGLVAKSSSATLTLTGGGHVDHISVDAITSLLNIVAMEPDPLRPLVYAVQQDGVNRGGLLIYDPVAADGVGFITVGEKPTDLAISADGQEALVLSSASQQIHVIDLVNRRVTEVINLPVYEEWGIADSAGRLCYGPGNLIYYSDGAWESSLRALDRSTGTVLQSKQVGVGDFAMLPDGSALVGWYRYGWTAGLSNSAFWRIPLAGNGTMGEKEQPGTGPAMSRDPLNTPVIVTPDGATVFAKQYAFSPTAFPAAAASFAGPVVAASTYGEVVATASGLYDFTTGNELVSLPVESQVQAISSDYTRLVFYDGSQRELRVLEIIDELLDVDFGGGAVFPADHAAVIPPSELRWSALPGVSEYRVYLGTDESVVRQATPADAAYHGTVSTESLTLASGLATNTTYFWRVDVVVGQEVIPGIVRSFWVSKVAPDVRRLEAATVQAHRNLRATVNLTGESDGLTWSAAADVDWIHFVADTGTTPGALMVSMDASALAAGTHQATITLTHDDGEARLPVVLTVDALKLTHLKSDPGSAIAYAISEDDSQAIPRAHLLEIDTASETILRSIPVGSSVTDFAIHVPENRIYVTNWRPGLIIAVDRDSFAPVRTYGFKPWTSVGYGEGDPYRVTAGPYGRIVVEEYDQWIDVSLVDTQTGETLAKTFERQGGGASTAGGRYYYHGDSNSSGAELLRFDLLGDVFTRLAARRVSHYSYYGARVVVASDDGSRVFWNGGVFNSSLEEVWSTDDEIYSTNADGSLAFGETKIFDVDARSVAYAMPAATRVSAFNATTGKLLVQQGNRVAFYDLSAGVPLVAPVLTATALNDRQVGLEWTDDSLETSLTVQVRPAGGGDWTVLSTLEGNTITYTAGSLSPETSYEFRVRANTAADASEWSNVVTVATLPSPPVRPYFTTVTRTLDDAVLLHWEEGGEVDSVVVERRGPDDNEFQLIATLTAPTGESYTDTDPKRPSSQYTYRVRSFRGNQSSAYSYENSIYFPALSAPGGSSLPTMLSLDEGGLLLRTVSWSGNPVPAIRWYRDGILLSGQTDFTLRLENLDVLDSGTYHYELSSSQGSFVSNDMVVAVQPAAHPIAGAHNYMRHGYHPGGQVRMLNTLHYVGAVSSLGWQVLLPDGWSFVSTSPDSGAQVEPESGQTGYLEWAWVEAPPSGSSFTYTLAVPAEAAGEVEFAGLILGTKNNVGLQALLQPDPLSVPQVPWNHSADTDLDGRIGLAELLRVIELYNTRYGSSRTGRYQTDETTADRYATAPWVAPDTPVDLPDFHSADSDHDASISLGELLRVIELYNTRDGSTRTGGYRPSAETTDGFEPDPSLGPGQPSSTTGATGSGSGTAGSSGAASETVGETVPDGG